MRVDLNKRAVTGEVKVGGSPIDVKLSPDGSVFFVANQTRNGVSVIDPATMTETSFIPTAKGAHGLYYSRDLKSLYVSNRGDGSVSVIDVASRTVRTIWRFGGTPDMGGVSADGSQLWLAGRYSAAVYAIDTRDGHLLARIRVGNGPHGLQISPGPWSNGTDGLEQRAAQLGLPDPSDTVFHIHANVAVFADGKRQTVPANIGIDQQNQFLASLHTHDSSGVVHMEAVQPYPFKLVAIKTGGYLVELLVMGAILAVWV